MLGGDSRVGALIFKGEQDVELFKKGVVDVTEARHAHFRGALQVSCLFRPHRSGMQIPRKAQNAVWGLCATWNRKSDGDKSQTTRRGAGTRHGLSRFRRIKFGETAH